MALEKHVIELAAKDTVSPALKNIATNAEAAGRKSEEAAKKATRSTEDWSKAAAGVGKVLGGLAVIAVHLGNESEVVQKRLETSINNTGDSYDLLKGKIEDTTDAALKLGFDDEDASAALATLTDATGNAEDAMNALAIAEDVARGRGISLEAATNIVAAAEQGRYGALKRMGIAIDETSTKEEALAALHSKYAGQAEAYASTNAASWDRMGNAIENKMETIGGLLADFQGPLIALGGASQLIGPLGDAFEALGGKAKIANLATSALASSWIGPVGVAVGAAAAGFAIYKLITSESEAEKSARKLAKLHARGEVKLFSLEGYLQFLLHAIPIIPAAVTIHRLWATAHPEFLLAPRWNRPASELSLLLQRRMADAGVFQGQAVVGG